MTTAVTIKRLDTHESVVKVTAQFQTEQGLWVDEASYVLLKKHDDSLTQHVYSRRRLVIEEVPS